MKHPGMIEYVDGSAGGVVKRVSIRGLPRQFCFAGTVPIVRVIATTAGDKRSIVELGPDGEILRTTVQVRAIIAT